MEAWGKLAIINLVDCIPDTIRNKKNILSWASYLIDAIDMKTYGEPFLKRFALHDPKVAGYSYFQAIETSHICAHFSEESNTVFVNIFSCKDYDVEQAIDACQKFFGFKSYKIEVLTMMPNGDILQNDDN